MKKKRYQGLLLLALGSLMLTGCQEAPYALTEAEEALIVNYSAHVVSKYNNYQKDGLIYLTEEEQETAAGQEEQKLPLPEQDKLPNVGGTSAGTVEEFPEYKEEATLLSVYGGTGLTVTYEGNEITDAYTENGMYAMNAPSGKNYLVVKLKVENTTGNAIEFNNFSSGDSFGARYIMDSGKEYSAKNVTTILLGDFSTYEGTIASGAAENLVLLFEIPSETQSVGSLTLVVNQGDISYQINL